MGFWSVLTGGERPEMQRHVEIDEKKEAVASPLSSFLAGEVGQGVARHKGNILSDFSEAGKMRANEFMSMDADNFFTEKIQNPALQTFREDMLPLVREEFAGSLSGSGRFRTEEEAASRFTRGLAETRANFEMNLPQAQFKMAKEMKLEADKEAVAQYQDWVRSLPQYNPVLGQAMKFLQGSTSTGKTVLNILDAPDKGVIGDLFGAVGQIWGGGGGSISIGSIGVGGGGGEDTGSKPVD